MSVKCKFDGVDYNVGDEICGPDGHIQVCNPKGQWETLPEVCDESETLTRTILSARSSTAVSTELHSTLFPDDVVAAAQAAQKETGCLASVALAQWAEESGFGKFQMHAHNPFGMKWYSSCKYPFVTAMTKEWQKDHYIVVSAKFIAFPNLQTAFVEHGKLIMQGKPYAKCLSMKSDYKAFIQCFGPIYATEPKYSQDILKLIDTYELYKFDLPKC